MTLQRGAARVMGPLRPSTKERIGPSGGVDAALRVWLLGGFRVSVGSRTPGEDGWRLKKAKSLVKLLALSPGHRLHREVIMDRLWPGMSPAFASNNLRQTLHAARRALGDSSPHRTLRLKDGELVLCPACQLRVDVDAFEEAAETARRGREPAAFRAAVEPYTGELLPEDRYEEWAQERREELRETYLSLLGDLAGLYEQRDEYGQGIETLRKVVSVEPAREETHAGIIRLLALQGQRWKAIGQYERLRQGGATLDAREGHGIWRKRLQFRRRQRRLPGQDEDIPRDGHGLWRSREHGRVQLQFFPDEVRRRRRRF